jgi:AcrR family transcriptional regulator
VEDVPMVGSDGTTRDGDPLGPGPVRRLRRVERRDQIISAATSAYARAGFAATSLDDIAAEAGISRVILYRHFESKTDLYRAVLDRACQRLADTVGRGRNVETVGRGRSAESVGRGQYGDDSIAALLEAASADPDGFRLVFRYAAREPQLRDLTDALGAVAVGIARKNLVGRVADPRWAAWASQLAPAVTTEAVIAWLDAGQPDPAGAAARVGQVVRSVIQAAQTSPG